MASPEYSVTYQEPKPPGDTARRVRNWSALAAVGGIIFSIEWLAAGGAVTAVGAEVVRRRKVNKAKETTVFQAK